MIYITCISNKPVRMKFVIFYHHTYNVAIAIKNRVVHNNP